ncbi:MAG: hypothetical protein KDI36_09855 [Pseudomonadales bacterium]|nr:hypothetical protein [Pseudomonadales bacterium]
MAIQTIEAPADNLFAEISEIKQRSQYYDVDESLSEWELARQTSKTWSMEQD